ncbi:protein PET117 homolog, mitochondrial [Hemicordylus capensis]|uniref:protein PET117 homolog, mitochondrial n=1 Tax=Hemicordylus capensis TaxID=884348 RepID=UPI0023032181|nr:protein PET117 homolog, mitochondrial [Hemicordylus capensis]
MLRARLNRGVPDGKRLSCRRVCRDMSTTSKVVLGIAVLLSSGTVVGVHIQQKRLRERLREGVFRDLERQNRKQENLRLLEEQISLTKQLEMERSKMPLERESQ